MSTVPAVNEVAILEKQLADAKRRAAAPPTLAQRLREARQRRDAAEHVANRAETLANKFEAEVSAHAELVKSRHALQLPAPPPLQRIQFFSGDDVSQGKAEATKQMTREEIIADARAQFARARRERDAARDEVAAIEKQIAANPLWIRVRAEQAAVCKEFIAASDASHISLAGFDKYREWLESLAAKEDAIISENYEELQAGGLPELRHKIRPLLYTILFPEHLRCDLKNHFAVADAAVARLKASIDNY